jgi:hypothetical protein
MIVKTFAEDGRRCLHNPDYDDPPLVPLGAGHGAAQLSAANSGEANSGGELRRGDSGEAKMATVLVTGGSGFIGRRVVRELAGAGHAVRVLDLVPPVAPLDGVELVLGDVRDPDAVRRALAGSKPSTTTPPR